jgi:hypothetical protein
LGGVNGCSISFLEGVRILRLDRRNWLDGKVDCFNRTYLGLVVGWEDGLVLVILDLKGCLETFDARTVFRIP